MTNWQLRVDDIAEPVPHAGQVLARVLACGICGSDLHMLRHGAELREEGAWDLDPLITGSIGIDDVPQAFDDLADPGRHAKILVEPR